MPRRIPVIFSGDASIGNEKRIAYTNLINEILPDLRKQILLDKGYIKVISANGVMKNVSYMTDNSDLKTKVTALLSISPFPWQTHLRCDVSTHVRHFY